MNEEISLQDFKLSILALWKKKLLLVAGTIFMTLVGLVLTFHAQIVNTYAAKTTVYSVGVSSSQEGGISSINSYADIITSTKVCERAADLVGNNYGLDASDIQQMIGVQSGSDNILSITAYSTQPDLAVSVSNAVAEAFVREATSMAGSDAIRILDAATTAYLTKDGRKNILVSRLAFAVAGFGIMAVLIMCRELLSNQVRTVEQCVDENSPELLGLVPRIIASQNEARQEGERT